MAPLFAALLRAPQAPGFVILDGVEDSTTVDLIPHQTKSTVLVTARSQVLPANRGGYIEFDEMARDESVSLARSAVPELRDAQAEQLAWELGWRPLAIEATCYGLLSGGIISIEELLARLRENSVGVLSKAPLDVNLPWVYEAITARFRKTQPRVGLLLEFIAVLHNEAIPAELLRTSMEDALGAPYDAIDFQYDLGALRSRCLITVANGQMRLHRLTQRILCSQLSGETRTERCISLIKAVNSIYGTDNVEHPLSELPVTLTWHLAIVVQGIGNINFTENAALRFPALAAALIHTGRRFGTYKVLVQQLYRDVRWLQPSKSGGVELTTDDSIANIVGIHEILASLYQDGLISPEGYLALWPTLDPLAVTFLPPSTAIRLDVGFLEAAKDLYQMNVFSSRLEVYISLDCEIDRATMAWIQCLIGEARTIKGSPVEAAECLIRSWDSYSSMELTTARVRGQARVFRAMCRLILYTRIRIYQGEVKSKNEVATTMLKSVIADTQELGGDALAEAFYYHARAYWIAAFPADSSQGDQGFRSPKDFAEASNLAIDAYTRAGTRRYIAELSYVIFMVLLPFEHSLSIGVRGEQESGFDDLSPKHRKIKEELEALASASGVQNVLATNEHKNAIAWGDDFNAGCMSLAKFKWLILQSGVTEGLIRKIQTAAIDHTYRYESEYWYVEHVITICVALWQLGCPYGVMLEAAKESCAALGRQERFNALLRCLTGAPGDDDRRERVMDVLQSFL
jgi:hypothetical protein